MSVGTTIESVHTEVHQLDLARPYEIAFRRIDAIENVTVRIRTRAGSEGLGAASPEAHVTGETNQSCQNALSAESLAWLVGEDVRCLPKLCRQMVRELPSSPAARAAVDMALHDLLAKEFRLPLVEMLGRAHSSLPTSITIGILPVDATVDQAKEHLGEGFRVLKIKLGHSLEEDIERLTAVRTRLGYDFAIRVDPNQGYSLDDLRAFVKRTDKLEIEFVEQPTSVDLTESWRDLPEPLRRELAADESILVAEDAHRLSAPPFACGIFNIKLMKCGGIREAGRIATVAESSGTQLMWGCMDESAISIAAALHAALASPATRYLDLDGSLDLARDVAQGGFILRDGMMSTTEDVGLGVRWTG